MIYKVLLGLGDSLTYGARDEYGRSYPVELGKILSEEFKQDWVVINEGVCRETSADTLRRSYKVVQNYPEAQIVLLMAGTNDTKCDYPIDMYIDNIKQIVRIIKMFGKKVLIATLPPVDGSKMPCFSSDKSNKFIELYNKALIAFCNCSNIPIVDMSTDMGKYLVDGVHFNHDGYVEMSNRWANAIKEL